MYSESNIKTIKINNMLYPQKNNLKYKINQNKKISNEDCLACIMRLQLIYGAFFGMSPITAECPHNGSRKILFKRSYFFTIISLMCLSFVIYMVYFNILPYFSAKAMPVMAGIPTINLTLFEVSVLNVSIFSFLRTGSRIDELNGLVAIISNKKNYGLKTVFGEDGYKKLRKSSFLHVFFITSFAIVYGSQVLVVITGSPVKFNSTYLGAAGLYCVLAKYNFIFQLVLKMKILKIMFEKSYEKIKININEKGNF